jgi:stage III sporulation protein AD
MDGFVRICGLALLSVILILVLGKQEKDWSVLLIILGCCIVLTVGLSYLEPVLSFLCQIREMTGLEPEFIDRILKAVGIALLAEITALVCVDAGNSAMGKAIQITAVFVILWLALPLLNGMLELVKELLGDV